MRINAEGWLEGDGVTHTPSQRHSARAPEPREPVAHVWHTTDDSADGQKLAERIRLYHRGVDRPASWHVMICRDGALVQSVSMLEAAWHVGKPGAVLGRSVDSVNRCTVGTEIANCGRLLFGSDGDFYRFPYYRNPAALPSQRQTDPALRVERARVVAVHGVGFFDGFTRPQIASAEQLVRALVERFGMQRRALEYGHVDFDSPRKEDPGPIWQRQILPGLLDSIFGSRLRSIV